MKKKFICCILVICGVTQLYAQKRVTLKLNVSDIFNLVDNSYSIKYENVDVVGTQRYDSRRVNLTFTWRFGCTDIKAARQRSTGLEEETSRVGS